MWEQSSASFYSQVHLYVSASSFVKRVLKKEKGKPAKLEQLFLGLNEWLQESTQDGPRALSACWLGAAALPGAVLVRSRQASHGDSDANSWRSVGPPALTQAPVSSDGSPTRRCCVPAHR